MSSLMITGTVVSILLLFLLIVILLQVRERASDERVRQVNALAARYRMMRRLLDELPPSYISKPIRVRLLERIIETCHQRRALEKTQDYHTDITQAQAELAKAKEITNQADEPALIQGEQKAQEIRSLLKQLFHFIENEQQEGRLDAKTAVQNLARTAFLRARTLADLHITRAREAQANRKYRVAIECYHSAIDAMKKLQEHRQAQQLILFYQKQIKELDRLANAELEAQNLGKKTPEAAPDGASSLSEKLEQLMSEEEKWKKKQAYD